ncbi:OprD family outer membrane porin [Psychromonas sp. MME2]|uniref:OprD family outer membrane porin n=1 Tax=unclassified Psychromonas TaxID=2614957 RepID=UPI00339BC6E9
MKTRIFKRASVSAAVITAIATCAMTGQAVAADDVSPEYKAGYEKFVEDHKLSGGLFYFQRGRDRMQGKPDQDGKYHSNLSHTTTQLALNYNSGYAWDMVGLDLAGFTAYDLAVDESNPVNQENEFSFAASKFGDNYKSGNDGTPANGYSITTAALKLKMFDGAMTAKAGHTQLYVPGIIGVNWSYQPGTYQGGQVEGNFGPLYVTYAYANEYKAPWFKQTGKFYKAQAWGSLTSENEIDYIHGLAARYTIDGGPTLTASYGQSEGWMDSYFAKVAHTFDIMGGLNTSYQFYGSETNDNFYDGLAQLHAITLGTTQGAYSYRLEGTYVKAEGDSGNYLPRMTKGYGNSQGALEIWWDSRSDWNHNNEKAVFTGVTRTLDDLVDAKGWAVGLSGAYGWDAENGDGSLTNGKEYAYNVDVMYTVQDGYLKGTLFKLHYTDYTNKQDDLGDWAYPNMFSSEKDVKFHVVIPFSII